MFTLVLDPVVLEKMKLAFPSPPRAAEKALEKYRVLLEDLIFNAISNGHTGRSVHGLLYSIPVSTLTHDGPQLGAEKIRLHSWLKANKLELVKAVIDGSNISGLVSLVKLTDLVTIKNGHAALAKKLNACNSTNQISALLCSDRNENSAVFDKLYPDYFSMLAKAQKANVFDIAPIDIQSLESYIHWLNTKSTHTSNALVQAYTQQALTILAIAKHTNGFYPQRKKLSEFGRTYYSGLSVQNVNKTLRRAMLGNCWEYDIRSAVIAWKLTFAKELAEQLYPEKEYQRVFWASILYVENRKEFMRDVRAETYDKDEFLSEKEQESKIKTAITAIGFGARGCTKGWREKNGKWVNSSLIQIFDNDAAKDRFLKCPIIVQFIDEQESFDTFLANGLKTELPDVYASKLITPKKLASKSRAVAYLYQQNETKAMDVARAVLNKHGITPIANIHDAFIVKHKLSAYVKDEIELEMQEQMQNPYFRIKAGKLERFS